MTDVVLVYPYVDPKRGSSIFRFPPLGLGYIAAYLRERGVSAAVVDATFIGEAAAVAKAKTLKPKVLGVYSMFTMREASLGFAKALRGDCEMTVAGGPLPSVEPEAFLGDFDIAAIGEGEKTMLELAQGNALRNTNGIVYREKEGILLRAGESGGTVVHTRPRETVKELDSLPLPARDLLDNDGYLSYYRRRRRPPSTSIISSRGCPFRCDFCSHPVFGESFRERSPGNIADEVEQVLALGYERVFFQDDCFTLTRGRVARFCDEVERRGLHFGWECLSRVDNFDNATAKRMKNAGCDGVFFGLESGSDRILGIMNKAATAEQGRRAVEAAHGAGLRTGAFFIFGYPGDDDATMLETVRYSSRLPLDYVSFTFPYPIPGTGLHNRVGNKLHEGKPEPKQKGLIQHQLIYYSEVPELKLKFGIAKAMIQHHLRRRIKSLAVPFEAATDLIFRAI